MNYHILTYGCQMNVRDSEIIAGLVEDLGYMETDDPAKADLIIFNTCSVRHSAENKGSFGSNNFYIAFRAIMIKFNAVFVAVRINVLPEQHNFFVASADKSQHFIKYIFRGTASFPTPRIWNNTIAAEIVAAIHDVYKGTNPGPSFGQ